VEDEMKNKALGTVILIGFGLCQLWLLPGCEVNRGGVIIGSPAPPPPTKPGPPPWAPAHGRRAKDRHYYYYYPSHYVYYDTGRGLYFYLVGDGWRVSAHLPSGIHLEYADYVALELETGKPYVYFSEHKKKYPPGQLKKNKHKKHKKKWSLLDQKQSGWHREVLFAPVA
jgi:hypothetical protein